MLFMKTNMHNTNIITYYAINNSFFTKINQPIHYSDHQKR